MKPDNRYKLIVGIIGLLGAVFLAAPWAAQAQTPSTAFTYQGRLRSSGVYVDGACSFEFRLYDAPSGGAQLGPTVSRAGVTVTKGSFAVLLDFGSVFTGTARYLQINNVNCGRPGDPVSMTSRVALNPAPYALYAASANAASANWANITTMPAGFADGLDNGLTTVCALNQSLIQIGGAWTCAAVLDSHNSLQGLNDDDHPQYLLVNGSRPMSGTLNLNSNRVINLAPATASGQAVPFEQAIKVGDPAGGDLSGTYPNPEVGSLNGYPIATASPAQDQVFTWNGSQWQPDAPGSGGPAGGDLSGTYPNPGVAQIRGKPVANVAPTTGQVLCYNSAVAPSGQWEPTNVIKNSDAASGDLSGTYPGPTVARLQGRTIASTAPTAGTVLGWNGSAWGPAASGLGGAAGGDLNGTYPNPTVDGLQGRTVANTAPSTGQLLTWSGTQWAPANVSNLQGNQPVANIAPTSGYALQWKNSRWESGDVVIPGDAAGGDLAGAYPNPRVANDAVGMAQLNLPMGFGYASLSSANGLQRGFNYIVPDNANFGFIPTTAGQCLVAVQSVIEAPSGSADNSPKPYLRTGRLIGASQSSDSGLDMYYSPSVVSGQTVSTATANYVWNISPSTQVVKFGCRVWLEDNDNNWVDDETVHCRVMYICQ